MSFCLVHFHPHAAAGESLLPSHTGWAGLRDWHRTKINSGKRDNVGFWSHYFRICRLVRSVLSFLYYHNFKHCLNGVGARSLTQNCLQLEDVVTSRRRKHWRDEGAHVLTDICVIFCYAVLFGVSFISLFFDLIVLSLWLKQTDKWLLEFSTCALLLCLCVYSSGCFYAARSEMSQRTKRAG